MHDLLWSFAHHLEKDENSILAEGEILNKPRNATKLRRLSIVGNNVNFEDVKNQIGVRTLLIHGISQNVLDDLCTTLLNLRILDIACSNISNLPNSLFCLVHLRYLNASMLEIKTIPESIGRLKNLVYLNFSNCKQLTHVPHKITHLKKLMYLSFFGTKFEGIPSGLKNFEKLTHLFGFKPNNNSSKGLSGLEELEPLLYLVTLHIDNLDQVIDINSANEAKLCCKDQLQHLTFSYTRLHRKDQVSQTNENKVTIEGVLNELCPPHSLETLKIHGYFGCTLPNWMNLGANLPNLRYLELKNCNCIKSLAPLGQLSNLNLLRIAFVCSIVIIGEEFFWEDIEQKGTKVGSCSNVPPFPKLTELTFEQLNNWKGWHWNKGEIAMPIKKLFIRNCPQLRYLPKGLSHHATSLEYLEIKSANALTQVENFSFIQQITLFRNQNLRRISNLPKISHIKIEMCPKLKTVENLSALQKMDLVDVDMQFLPKYLMTITPSKLRINCSEELLWVITSRENDSEWHKFKHIPSVTIHTIDESQHATYQKTPFSFTTNVLGYMMVPIVHAHSK